MPKNSDKIEAVLKDLDIDDLYVLLDKEVFDASCTLGYNNDGSTGLEIFMNGFNFGKIAGDQNVHIYCVKNAAFFIIGDEEHCLKKIKNNWRNEST